MLVNSTARRLRLASLVVAVLVPVAAVAPAVASAPRVHRGPARHHVPAPERAWLRDVSRALSDVPGYLDARAREGDRAAVVLGIDDVALATHYDWPRGVPPTLRVVRHARRLGIAVFFVTGRFDRERRHLGRLLHRAGFEFDGLCTRAHGVRIPVAKEQCRRAIAGRGYTITANISSNGQAFHGGYYELAVRLPSPRGGRG